MRTCYNTKDIREYLTYLLNVNNVNELKLSVPFNYVTEISIVKFVKIKRNSKVGRVRLLDEANKPHELKHLTEKNLVSQFNNWQHHFDAFNEVKATIEFCLDKDNFGKEKFDLVLNNLHKDSSLMKKLINSNLTSYDLFEPSNENTLNKIKDLFSKIKECYRVFSTKDDELSLIDQANKLYLTTGDYKYKKLSEIYEDSEYYGLPCPAIAAYYKDEFSKMLDLIESRNHSMIAVNFNSSWDAEIITELMRRGYKWENSKKSKAVLFVLFRVSRIEA